LSKHPLGWEGGRGEGRGMMGRATAVLPGEKEGEARPERSASKTKAVCRGCNINRQHR